ncbi:phosphoglycerate dehydrogenase [Sulfuricystis thermophila]|uniref:phosphoglycerate dehydrogenase n=1 Tax=Sulfuricystis thermophila TaxID=2496847 RepID=UPI0010357EE8|nr:phosphoglycerate dehydrogenase [Sulfuricystis thermophila]
MAEPFQVLVLNNVSPTGLKRLGERFVCAKEVVNPDAILLRSADLRSVEIPRSVLAIGRAGSGTNNIPVAAMSQRGVPVFNAPGANANAVKELVLAGMLMAARNLPAALKFVAALEPNDPEMEKKVEAGKKTYAGFELAGHTLGVVGLGKIGCLVADAAIKLGMQVIGYDPEITVDAAWSLPSQVKKANSLVEVLKGSHFITLHVPLVTATKKMIDAERIALMKHGAVLLNFAREGVVDEAAVLTALETKKLATYVCDFPSAQINSHPQVIALPHLGASTREAEENCAIMVADQLRDYLLDGNIVNAVNFPNVVMPRESAFRIAVANANVPNMVGQITAALAGAGLNIHNMVNKSKQDVAYTLVDVDSAVPKAVIEAIAKIDGVLAVRYLPQEG